MSEHIFELVGTWKDGMRGSGQIAVGELLHEVSAPAGLGGSGVGTNPEELILGASSSCYLITLAAILDLKRVPSAGLRIKSRATFDATPRGPVLKKIQHFPELLLRAADFERAAGTINACFDMAKQGCMISTALRGNAEVSAHGTVVKV